MEVQNPLLRARLRAKKILFSIGIDEKIHCDAKNWFFIDQQVTYWTAEMFQGTKTACTAFQNPLLGASSELGAVWFCVTILGHQVRNKSAQASEMCLTSMLTNFGFKNKSKEKFL